MNAKQRAARDARIKASLEQLVTNVAFRDFMDLLAEQREVALEDALAERVIANERTSLTALGEVRCYNSIIAVYREILANPTTEEIEDAAGVD